MTIHEVYLVLSKIILNLIAACLQKWGQANWYVPSDKN